MTVWPKVALGELLQRSDEFAVLDPSSAEPTQHCCQRRWSWCSNISKGEANGR